MKQNIYLRIIFHILFWCAYVLACVVIYGFLGADWKQVLRATLLFLPAIAIPTYIIIYVVIPKLLFKKKYLVSISAFVLLPLGFTLLQRYSLILFNLFPGSENYTLKDLINYQFLMVSFEAYLMISIAVGIKLFKLWFHNQQIRTRLEVQNLQSELSLMKAQVNPHFLFNTLNNIHSYIHYDRERSADAIIKLSEIMRYMLYETNAEVVALNKEISYIKSYIDLQQMRFDDEDAISLKVTGITNNKKIPPMLFTAFLENAFKHGDKSAGKNAVTIKIEVADSFLNYEVRNFVNPLKKTQNFILGFGITNLQKRLKLLYPDKYTMKTEVIGNEFIAKLSLLEF